MLKGIFIAFIICMGIYTIISYIKDLNKKIEKVSNPKENEDLHIVSLGKAHLKREHKKE